MNNLPLKILHTGDTHLGMTFKNRNYPEQLRKQLVEARFTTLEKVVEKANKEDCQLFLIAGDLFHRPNISEQDVIKTLKILSKFTGNCVAILPGNHDHYDEYSSLWKKLRENAFDNLIILSETKPYELNEYNLDLTLYPSPCNSKHSDCNRLGWLRELKDRPSTKWHIGVAHGSVKGVSPDFDSQYFPMEENELRELALQHWCLGHTHIRYPDLDLSRESIFTYCGTPEPDGFDCNHSGFSRITILDDSGNCQSHSFTTGHFNFKEITREISCLDELKSLTKEVVCDENTLLKLILKGKLIQEEYDGRSKIFKELKDSFAYVELEETDLSVKITPDDISSKFTKGSFPYLLLTRLAKRGEDEALQIAYQLIEEVKK